MAANVSSPTRVEVDSAEKVISEAVDPMLLADGYWRTLATDVLEAARDARLREFVAIVDSEFDASVDRLDFATGQGRR